jgi:putative pyruvate formate lyase activating enzyme
MPSTLTLARAALHHWEEPCISGTRGSGTVFFTGCPLKCSYCQNRDIALGKWGKEVPDSRLGEVFRELAAAGAHNINLVTPTHYAPTIEAAIRRAKEAGFDLPFVWNTSGYERVETLRRLEGLVDIYLTDLRYSSPPPAKRYSGAPDYPQYAKAAIREMVRQTGACVFAPDGLLLRGTVVRILLLPGGLADAKLSVLHLWRAYGDSIFISLMQQYTPMLGMAPPLDRRVTEHEYRALVDYATRLGITNAYTQDRAAATDSFIPPFDLTGV